MGNGTVTGKKQLLDDSGTDEEEEAENHFHIPKTILSQDEQQSFM